MPRRRMNHIFNSKTILVTGGTGSFGKALIHEILNNHKPKAVRVYSRDELKQWEMSNQLSTHPNFDKLRFFLGDVRDKDRLMRACDDVDIIVHAAALKQVPAAEYNPGEFIKTNIFGAQNVIDAALDCGVQKVVALSTDKAAAPINLYGATKLCAEKLFIAANNVKGKRKINFSVVRYGNVMGSRGSVMPYFLEKRHDGIIPITHPEMTRFNILLMEAIDLVMHAVANAWGGEIFVPKLPSYKIIDLAQAVAPKCKIKITGIRPGEKMHEEMITETESINTIEFPGHYVVLPNHQPYTPAWDMKKMIKKLKGERVNHGFKYSSGANDHWLTVDDIRRLIKQYLDPQFVVET